VGRWARPWYFQTTTWGRFIGTSGVPVKARRRYRVSVWAKVGSGKFQLGVCDSRTSKYFGEGREQWVLAGANGEWTQYSKEVVVQKGTHAVSTIMFIQSGSGYLDDFEVVDLGEVEETTIEEDRTPLLKGALAPAITRKRIALFDEPDFPSESPRSVAWYEETLTNAGLEVTRLGWRALADSEAFSRDKFDTLILPTGGNFPYDIGVQVEDFLARGGAVVIDEHMMVRTKPFAPEFLKKKAELEARRQRGEGLWDYCEFLSKHAFHDEQNVYRFDPTEERWAPHLFPEASGRAYPARKEAGNDPKDRESDFNVRRYHNLFKEGGTLVHFGNAGARLLRTDQGGSVLLASLRLAESALPGECPPAFVAAANGARGAFSEYSGKSLKYRGLSARLAQLAAVEGRKNKVAEHRRDIAEETQRFHAYSSRAQALEKLLLERSDGFVYGQRGRERLLAELGEEIRRLDAGIAELASVSPYRNAPRADVPIKYPHLDRIYFGLDTASGRGPAGLADLRDRLERMGLPYAGWDLGGHRHDYARSGYFLKERREAGILDPKTGEISPQRFPSIDGEAELARASACPRH